MEYQIYNKIRNNCKIPYFLRFILAIIFLLIAIIGVILPIIPGIPFFIAGIILIIPGERIRDLIKIRKGFVYMIIHLRERRIVRQKVHDILRHSRNISFGRKPNKFRFLKNLNLFGGNNGFKKFFN